MMGKYIVYSITWVCKNCAEVCGSTDRTVPFKSGCTGKFSIYHDWIPVKAEVVKYV